jgi:hypothetical protein
MDDESPSIVHRLSCVSIYRDAAETLAALDLSWSLCSSAWSSDVGKDFFKK